MKRLALFIVASGILTIGCIFGPAKTDKSEQVLARVDGKTITAQELDSLAVHSAVFLRDTTDIESLKADLLDSLIDMKLIEIRVDSMAAALEYDRDFLDKRGNEVADVVFRLMFDGEVTANVNVDSAEIVEYYRQNPDRFKDPEQVKAAHILVSVPRPDTAGIDSEEKKKKIIVQNDLETLKRAEAILALARKGENWDSLVVKYSQDGSNNKKGGDLGYFPRGKMVPSFDSVAFAAEVGEIIGPVKTNFGYNIIKINDRKPEALIELDDELYEEIKNILFKEKEKEFANRFLDSLKASANYVYNEEILGQPDSLLEPDLWVLVINDTDTLFENKVQETFPKYLRFKRITDWTAQDKKDMLKEISVSYLLRAKGKMLGYYDDPKAVKVKEDFTRREAQQRVKRMMRDLEYQPTKEEIERFFNENFEERYKEKKPLHVQHIIFEDSARALVIRDSILAGEDFKEMALRYYPGEPEIREVAFDLGFISEEELGKDFFDQVNTLEVVGISLPI